MAIRRRNIDFESTEDAALLYLYAAFDSENSMWCTTRKITDGIVDANFNEVSMALTTLADRGLVDKEMREYRASRIATPTMRQRSEFRITRAGIDLVMAWTEEKLSQTELKLVTVNSVDLEAEGTDSAGLAIPDIDHTTSENWLEPDELGAIAPETEEKIRELIRKAIDDLDSSDLTNEEKSQASAVLKAAQSLANAPTPQWGKVKGILEPLSQVAAIGGTIIAIIALL